jgi:iron-sulfur cluster repair protein YtfE (RIC family)
VEDEVHKSLRKVERTEPSLVALLSECHQRIRHFIRLAGEIAARTEAPLEQVVQACEDVKRYFSIAFPLHVADEEQSVLPRLHPRCPQLEQALNDMPRQHLEHAPKLQGLLARLDAVRATPRDSRLRAELGSLAAELEQELSAHLALEEDLIFPALAQLETGVQEQIVAELRARRASAPTDP